MAAHKSDSEQAVVKEVGGSSGVAGSETECC